MKPARNSNASRPNRLIGVVILCLIAMIPISCALRVGCAMHEFRQASRPFEELGGYASGPEMGPLGGAAGITVVRLDGTETDDHDLERLRSHLESLPNLRALLLSETNITNDGLRHLAGLSQLEELEVHKTAVTADGIASLKAKLPQCKVAFGPYP